MKTYGRRMVSLLLALVMALSLCSVAWADNTPTYEPFTGVTSNTLKTFLDTYTEYGVEVYDQTNNGATETYYYFYFNVKDVNIDYDDRQNKMLCMTADSYTKLGNALTAYDGLSESDKNELAGITIYDGEISQADYDASNRSSITANANNQLKIDDGYFRQVYNENTHMGLSAFRSVTDPNNLTATNAAALAAAKEFLSTYIDYNNGDIMIKDTEFDNGVYTSASLPHVEGALEAFDELNYIDLLVLQELYVTDGNDKVFFANRMSVFAEIFSNSQGGGNSGDTQNEELRNAGYTAPELGKDFTLEFPSELTENEDYSYTYEDGTLTVTVKAGNREHWAAAANNSDLSNLYVNLQFKQPEGYSYGASDTGNGTGGVWTQYINGSVKLEEFSALGNGQPLAAVNKQGDKLVITPNDQFSGNRMVVAWDKTNTGTLSSDAVKFMLLLNVVVEDNFRYTVDGSGIQNVPTNRMTVTYETGVNSSDWKVMKADGSLTLRPASGQFDDNKKVATLTITQPGTGYSIGKVEQSGGRPGENKSTSFEIPLWSSGSSGTYTLTWRMTGADDIKETITVKVTDGNKFSSLGKYDADGNTLSIALPSEPVATSAVSAAPATGMTVTYDEASGYFETSFKGDTVPSVSDLQQCIILKPPTGVAGATKLKVHQSDGNWDPETWTEDDIKDLLREFNDVKARNYTPGSTDAGNYMLYMMTGSFERQDITVYYASQQQWRLMVVQWLDAGDNVLGYTWVYGKNGPLACEVTTNSVKEDELEEPVKEPCVIGENMEFTCELFPQDGEAHKQYFEFHVSGKGCEDHEGKYKVYLPYSYFGMTGYEEARGLKNKPVIYHYYDDKNELREDAFYGEYTEYGVCFEVESFSPFVIDCDQTKATPTTVTYYYNSEPTISAVKTADEAASATDYTSGAYGLTFRSTAAFSGFRGVQVDGKTIGDSSYIAENNGGGIEVYLKAVYLRALRTGTHTMTIITDSGSVTTEFTVGGESPKTLDPGIAFYAATALASLTGGAWLVARKKH